MKTFLTDADKVPEGKTLLVNLEDGSEILLFKLEGHIFGINNSCPHMGGPLSEGEIEGSCVTCPWHGYQFDFTTGNCTNMPGYEAEEVALEVEEGKIYLNPGL